MRKKRTRRERREYNARMELNMLKKPGETVAKKRRTRKRERIQCRDYKKDGVGNVIGIGSTTKEK